MQQVNVSPAELGNLVVHEVVHAQQFDGVDGFLPDVIREGAADYIASRIATPRFDQKIYEYGFQHEDEPKAEFRKDLEIGNYAPWFGPQPNGRPADLGYFIGYRIVEACLRAETENTETLEDVLFCQAIDRLLEKSHYLD